MDLAEASEAADPSSENPASSGPALIPATPGSALDGWLALTLLSNYRMKLTGRGHRLSRPETAVPTRAGLAESAATLQLMRGR